MSSSNYPGTIPVAVYYVVPIESSNDGKTQLSDDHTQACNYYVRNADDNKYSLVMPTQLQAIPSGLGIDYIVLQQLSPSEVTPPPLHPTENARLFSATAKNSQVIGDCIPLPNVFLAATATSAAGSMPTLAIPVAPPEQRGLILIFSVLKDGKTLLRGTSDPEIKGSTN
jgi:hypothetical protein